jgi:hypothetical protein
MMRLQVTDIDDMPRDLREQLPFAMTLQRMLPGSDRPDYWIAALEHPLRWKDGGHDRKVEHVVVATRMRGTEIRPGIKDVLIGIAYVVDVSQIDDTELHFEKCRYVAVGVASEVDG